MPRNLRNCCLAFCFLLSRHVAAFLSPSLACCRQHEKHTATELNVGDARGDYYGESAGSYMVQEFNTVDQLEEIVKLASMPLPERPDGIVAVAKFSSASSSEARATEAEFERIARNNPATLFLRCFKEYENADLLFDTAQVSVIPTFDVFYQGNRVSRVEGTNHAEVEKVLARYQFQNSKLDLFSEEAKQPWGKDSIDPTKTPRTTNRFFPGYDWNKGLQNEGGGKDGGSTFEDQFESWLPNLDDK